MDYAHFKANAWEFVRAVKKEIDKAVAPILEAEGLSMHQAGIIIGISSGDFRTIGELAEHFSVNQGNFSAICKKLEKMGLVSRRRSSDDERVVIIELTELGKEKTANVCKGMEELFRKADASPEQLETIIAGYGAIIGLLNKINKGETDVRA
ncbi:MAG: MarR family winged helix-turn-helix transcriptional regulator [Oscillospiraceae bacterium]|jgi:DNA-binding MarR family transcriptional regulator|nr:MarR family winged helix-turn-helix transcriptional regulator [Oscillospiraceae bacterium]